MQMQTKYKYNINVYYRYELLYAYGSELNKP